MELTRRRDEPHIVTSVIRNTVAPGSACNGPVCELPSSHPFQRSPRHPVARMRGRCASHNAAVPFFSINDVTISGPRSGRTSASARPLPAQQHRAPQARAEPSMVARFKAQGSLGLVFARQKFAKCCQEKDRQHVGSEACYTLGTDAGLVASWAVGDRPP